MDNILKSFEYLSSFRAGYIAVAGLLGHAIFTNASNNGLVSFKYIGCSLDVHKYGPSYVYAYEDTKKSINIWKNVIMFDMNLQKTGILNINVIPQVMSKLSKDNLYYMDQLLLMRAYAKKRMMRWAFG